MIKLMIGVFLITTTMLAQGQTTAPQSAKTGSSKPASASASSASNSPKQTVTSAKTPSKSTTKSASTSTVADAERRSSKPIPKPSLKDNLESKDNAIPSYKKEKDAGVHKTRYRYPPSRTASGARTDTLDKRKQ